MNARSFDDCRVSRRDLLKLASLGVLAPPISGWFPGLAAHAAQAKAEGKRPKACILLWMAGGPSQVHTFNIPTEGEHQEYKGMATAVPGIRISEYLPKLAGQMKDLALLQTMSTGVNVHEMGQYLMHIGFRQGAQTYPTLGSIAAKELGNPDLGIPNYVCIGGGLVPPRSVKPGPLGPNCGPLMVGGKGGVDNLISDSPGHDGVRAALLDRVEKNAIERFQSDAVIAHQASYRKAFELMHSDKNKVFDLKSEPAKYTDLYGAGEFGQQCLLARRLVEIGVPFVEVCWGGLGTIAWDSHGGGAEPVKQKSPALDAGFSALITDLKERGLLDSTLIVWMGEFGRGPRPGLGGGVSAKIGGGHYATCWTTVLAGGGLKTGQIVGKSTRDAVSVVDRPISAPDFLATICKALGIPPHKKYDMGGGRLMPYTAFDSEVVKELF